MDPITLALLLGGGYLGYKKVYPWAKNQVATFQSRFQLHGHAPQALPMQLDPGLSQAQLGEVANLLTNVRTASLVRAAADERRRERCSSRSQVTGWRRSARTAASRTTRSSSRT